MFGARSKVGLNRLCGYLIFAIAVIAIVLVAGCSTSGGIRDGAPTQSVNVSKIPDAVPKVEPKSKYGNQPSYVVHGKRYHVKKSATGYVERGIASWYGTKFHGRRTSSGEPYNMYTMTAAHRSLPLPTYAEVTNLENNRRIIVRINDRGPFHSNRIIDLSYAAAKKLGITANGTGMVEVRAIDPRSHNAKKTPTQTSQQIARSGASYQLFLQVGAFMSRSNAERLRGQLLGVVNNHRVDTGYSSEDKLYRVRIGPIPSVETADRLAQRITGMGLAEPQVVIN